MTEVGGSAPVVSVIITCRGGDAAAPTIESARGHSTAEVIVVWTGAEPPPAALVGAGPGLRWVTVTGANHAGARNAGLATARGTHVVFLRPPERLLPAAIGIGIGCLAGHPDAALVYGRSRRSPSAPVPVTEDQATRSVDRDHYVELLRGDYIPTSAVVMYRRAALEELGGYDTSLLGGEDYDLNLRATRRWPSHFHGETVAEGVGDEHHDACGSMARTTSAMRVLRRQRDHLGTDRWTAAAYETGMAALSRQLGIDAVTCARTRRGAHAAAVLGRFLVVVVRLHRRGLVTFLSNEILPWYRRRAVGTRHRGVGPNSDQRVVPSSARIVRDVVASTLPAGSAVLVVNQGDPAMLRLGAYSTAPFPSAGAERGSSGTGSEELEAARAGGAEFLVVPAGSRWWFDQHSGGTGRYVDATYPRVWSDAQCVVYRLGGGSRTTERRVLIAGHFSYTDGHATAGDLLAREMLRGWLEDAGVAADVALVPPFRGGVDWRRVDPSAYSDVIFTCGPFPRVPVLEELVERFAGCRRIGLNLSMTQSLQEWNPFDVLLERDSPATARPDMVFGSPRSPVPVVGVCLREHATGTRTANAVLARLIASTEMAVIEIDTRLDFGSGDANSTGLRSPAEVESLLSRVDVILTTRLHGLVLGLKNGVPTLAIDPGNEGRKILRQADLVGWPTAFDVREVDDEKVRAAFEWCLGDEARSAARQSAATALHTVEELRTAVLTSLSTPPQGGR